MTSPIWWCVHFDTTSPELVGMPLTQFSRSIHQWLSFNLIHKRPLPSWAIAADCGYCSAVWNKPAGYKQLSSAALVLSNETVCSKQRSWQITWSGQLPSVHVTTVWYFADRASQYIYLNINQLDALNFIMSLFHASTCFEHKRALSTCARDGHR